MESPRACVTLSYGHRRIARLGDAGSFDLAAGLTSRPSASKSLTNHGRGFKALVNCGGCELLRRCLPAAPTAALMVALGAP